MTVSLAYRPVRAFERLGPEFADPVAPARFPQKILRWRNQEQARRVGLDTLSDAEWENAFAAFQPLPDNIPQPLAIRYHGHQFRSYNPDIGDGRGFLFAQLYDDRGRLLDLGTKGSGQTPYSRFGDGRLTLKGGVREVLAAGMLEALGVYTSKALSLFETGEELQRSDEPSPTRSSVLVRLSHSHIRFGVFQRLAFVGAPEALRALADHCGDFYHPEILAAPEADRAAALLSAAVRESARLAAQWMAAGFVHGVLNTDNLNITGESFDYGPWRFLPTSDPGFVAAYFDQTGLYRFGRQPEAVYWALAQLAGALAPVGERAGLEAALSRFPALYAQALRQAFLARLGLAPSDREEADLVFVQDVLAWMTQSQISWAGFFHDWFCGRDSAARAARGPNAAFYAREDFEPVRDKLLAFAPVRPQRLAHAYFERAAPFDLVYDTVEALWAPIAAQDDWSRFNAAMAEIAIVKDALGLADGAVT